MAFAQQQRRQRPAQTSSPLLRYDSEREEDDTTIATTNLILSPRLPPPPAASDSDNEWHIIGSALASSPRFSSLPTNARRNSASTSFDPSEPESLASFRPSDTESFSDLDTQTSLGREEFSNLPAHDGTGTFMDDPGLSSDVSQEEAGSPSSFARAMHRIMLDGGRGESASEGDFEPASNSMPNILLPHGGITIPSFAITPPEQPEGEQHRPGSMSSTPSFRPTVAGAIDSQQFSDEDTGGTQTTTSSSGDVKFTRRRRRNLDSIPSHHPAIPGAVASSAVLSAIWDQVRRITTKLLENDANTSDTFCNLASEAAIEGCLPFGSHLHMELSALHTRLEQS